MAQLGNMTYRCCGVFVSLWNKRIYWHHAGMKMELGGKGANLAEMTKAGLPVPPGFTITTQACRDYYASGEQLPAGLMDEVNAALRELEKKQNKQFGDAQRPLLVSVRSGSVSSMPGMDQCRGSPVFCQ